jgi:hypothetical protein
MREELNQIGFNLNSDASTSELVSTRPCWCSLAISARALTPPVCVGLQYPHGLSHFLGMDLHDCPTMRKDAAYAAGNVTTIEPGYARRSRIALSPSTDQLDRGPAASMSPSARGTRSTSTASASGSRCAPAARLLVSFGRPLTAIFCARRTTSCLQRTAR